MGDGMLVTPFRVDGEGYIPVEQFAGPGLGIEVDEAALQVCPPHPAHVLTEPSAEPSGGARQDLLFDGFEPREAGKVPPSPTRVF